MSGSGKPKARPTGDYAIGYAKPPESRQFKPRESGNRSGKRKGTENLKTVAKRVFLGRKIVLNEQGRKKKVSVFEGMLLRVAERAINKGDPRALTASLSVMQRFGFLTEMEAEALQESLSSADQQMLDAFLERKGVRRSNKNEASGKLHSAERKTPS